MDVINQKEYLKKYLSGKKDKKKKKHKKDNASERVKIIDDDVDLSKISTADNEDLYGPNEDAPQIVGVIDDRPMHMRIDDYRKSNMWRPLGAANDPLDADCIENTIYKSDKEIVMTFFKNESLGIKPTKIKRLNKEKKVKAGEVDKNVSRESRWDISRREKALRDTDNTENDGNISPLRKDVDQTDMSSPRKARRNSDSSPPRKEKHNSDSSPPRKKRQNSDSSPPRKERRNSDSSPPRKKRQNLDSSPPRKARYNSDNSPSRKTSKSTSKTSNNSPPRKSRKRDHSPYQKYDRQNNARPRDSSPPKRKLLPGDKKGKYLIPAKRMDKTLDGKKAGLQNAQELVKENQEFRKREDELFKNMSTDMSGANAATIIRDRKTGKVRDLEKEAQERLEKEKQDEANKEKYMRWGKGLKQVEDYESKLQDALHEMDKPLARYADDEDLERYLKEQDREGDPMLDYIKKKRRKNDIDTGKPVKQQFEGEFMPNRFGIRPGHRWDGVNRSNGYEKKWIEVQNNKNAIQEEIYKWSTEDM